MDFNAKIQTRFARHRKREETIKLSKGNSLYIVGKQWDRFEKVWKKLGTLKRNENRPK